jgi:hypothetical protein
MPMRYWEHDCAGSQRMHAVPQCDTCGVTGKFLGWRFTRFEAMACEQYVYRLKPMGRHRRRAHDLLYPLRRRCGRCSGYGLLDVEGDRSWRVCPECEGTGGFWTVGDEEVEAARALILSEFPDAAAPAPRAFIGVPLVHSLRTNVVLGEGDQDTER